MRNFWMAAAAVLLVGALLGRRADAQAFGIELHNTLMPASGGMGGVSLALPQDLQSALNGNPATLSQFRGTQFSMSGVWGEPTYNVQHTGGVLPNVGNFSAKSQAQGAVLGNIGVTQDLRALGVPGTVGMGLIASSGAGVDFRHVPASNGTTAFIQGLQVVSGAGLDLTDRLSAGANIMLGTGTIDGPFIGLTAAAYDYALRGSVGLNYDVTCCTKLGFYYQTSQSYQFDDAVRLELPGGGFSTTQDINMQLPDNIGIGIANRSLMNGRLLLATDILFKQWENADFFQAFYQNQWVFQLGAQYQYNRRVRFRLGYVYAENAIDPNPGLSAGGVTPPGPLQAGIEYIQAQFAAINEHRMTAGVGVRDVLPGVDFDLFAGGMFHASEDFGAFTSADVEAYWIGAGVTWRFGRGSCCRLPVPDEWCFQ